MKFRKLFQIVALLAILFSAFGTGQQAQARQAAQVVVRELTYWDATFTGNVDATRYEKWSMSFDKTYNFVVTATPTTTGFTPLILLLNSTGAELSRSATGSLTSSQPLGSYFVQIQPSVGSGSYNLTIRQIVLPSLSVVPNPTSINVGAKSTVTVSLNNVPAEGYTAAEFTCTYNATLVKAGDFVADSVRFGADAVVAINDPQNGSFIFAIAGSNGKKATTSGAVFTFSLTGLQAGTVTVECKARVSIGGTTLADIPAASAPVIVTVPLGTITGKVLACKPVTITFTPALTPPTTAAAADGSFTRTVPAGTYTVVASAPGFLSAKKDGVVVAAGGTVALPNVTLLAGDVDNNAVIDQLDAQTIGMNYNAVTPAAADLNCSGKIDILDLELLARNFRKVGPILWP